MIKLREFQTKKEKTLLHSKQEYKDNIIFLYTKFFIYK